MIKLVLEIEAVDLEDIQDKMVDIRNYIEYLPERPVTCNFIANGIEVEIKDLEEE